MPGFADLIQSERGVFALAVLVAATILAVLHVIDGAMWLDFVRWVTIALIASKTFTSAVEIHTTGQPQNPTGQPQNPKVDLPAAKVE